MQQPFKVSLKGLTNITTKQKPFGESLCRGIKHILLDSAEAISPTYHLLVSTFPIIWRAVKRGGGALARNHLSTQTVIKETGPKHTCMKGWRCFHSGRRCLKMRWGFCLCRATESGRWIKRAVGVGVLGRHVSGLAHVTEETVYGHEPWPQYLNKQGSTKTNRPDLCSLLKGTSRGYISSYDSFIPLCSLLTTGGWFKSNLAQIEIFSKTKKYRQQQQRDRQ